MEENTMEIKRIDYDFSVCKDDGWKAFRIQGVLAFSLIGILSEISGILADNKICKLEFIGGTQNETIYR